MAGLGEALHRLLRPILFLALLGVAHLLLPTLAAMLDRELGAGTAKLVQTGLAALAWPALAFLLIRLLDAFVWPRTARRPPRLLTDLVAALVWIVAAMLMADKILGLPLAGIVTTSGVAVAVLGFALRDMLASLFAGIALNLERPHETGDWLEVAPGKVGRVVEVGWLTTRLVSLDGLGIVVPNAQLASQGFVNFNRPSEIWRDAVTVTLGYEVSPVRAERILLAAAAEVMGAHGTGRRPDAKIVGCGEQGVVWQLRYWLKDYAQRVELQHRMHAAVLRHLYKAGLGPAYPKLDLYHAPMPARALDHRTQLDILLARSDLFGLLDPEELRGLAQNARRCRTAAGTPVVRQGEAGDSLFVVVEGVLEVEVTTEDGRRHRMRLLAPGDMFGEYSLLTGAPRSATVTARTDSLLFEITKGDLMPVLERCPELAAAMSRILAARQTSRGQLAAGEAELAADLAPHAEPSLLGRICAFFGLPH